MRAFARLHLKKLVGAAIILAVSICYFIVPLRFTCLGDCVFYRVQYCLEMNDADCIVVETTKRYLQENKAREYENIEAEEIARAIVDSGGGARFVTTAPAVVGVKPGDEGWSRMSALLDAIIKQYLDRGQQDQLDAFVRQTIKTFGVTPGKPDAHSAANNESDLSNPGSSMGSTDVGLLAVVNFTSSYYFSRDDEIYPSGISMNGRDWVFSEKQCASAGPTGLFGLDLRPAGHRELAALRESIEHDSGSTIDSILSQSNSGTQLFLLASTPRESFGDRTDVRAALGKIGAAISAQIAELAKQLRSLAKEHKGELPFPLYGHDENSARLEALYRQFRLNLALYLNWIALALDVGDVDKATQAAANLYELMLRTDWWMPRDALWSIRSGGMGKIAMPGILRSLSYVLASRGVYGLPLAYIKTMRFQEVQLKAEMTSCVVRGLIYNRQYAETIEVLRSLSPSTLAILEPKYGKSSYDASKDEVTCGVNPAFGATCEILLSISQAPEDSEGRARNNIKLRRDSRSFFEHLEDELSEAISADDRLNDRWHDILSYIGERLSPDAAQLADVHRRLRLKEYVDDATLEAKIKDDRNSILHFVEANYRVHVLLSRGDSRQAFEAALVAGYSDRYDGPVKNEALMREIAISIIAGDGGQWMVETIRKRREYPNASPTGKTLTFIIRELLAAGNISEAITLQSDTGYYGDGDEERRVAVATELVRRHMKRELITIFLLTRSQYGNPLKLALRLVPVYVGTQNH
jgi:hypothetical protein